MLSWDVLEVELPEDVAAPRKMAKRHCNMYFGYHIVRLDGVYQEKKRRLIAGKLTSMQLPDKSHFLRSQDKSVQRPIEGICSFMSKGSAGSASMLTSLQNP